MHRNLLFALIAAQFVAAPARAQSNIDPTNKFGWGENVGWTNWRGEATPGQGVMVAGTFMGGFVWGENVGWINLGDGSPANAVNYANVDGVDFGVNIDPNGDLHGMAWGENTGWINFDGGAMATPPQLARIECDGSLDGFVWAENLGWFNLSSADPGKFVSVDAATVPIGCDLNHDGTPDGRDIQLFVEFVLMTSAPDWRDVCSGDLEPVPDMMIDPDDLAAFVLCLLA